MMTLVLVLVFTGTLPFSPRIPPIRAATLSFTLIGRIGLSGPAGWGFTKPTISSPGPDIIVSPGDTVTMTLGSADPPVTPHNWGVDYNNNTLHDPGEPISPNFMSSANITFQFTATNTPGRYLYYCFVHGAPMFGHFIVSPPDVAVTGIVPSRGFAYNGVSSNPIQVNVTAANLGPIVETFFVSAKANSTLIGNQTVTLDPGKTTVVTYQWTTTSLARGVYILTAQASKVPNEVDSSNNSFMGDNFIVRFKGDVNGDCKVNIIDFSTVGGIFGKNRTQIGYIPDADLNNDGLINIIDLVIVAGNFGQTC